MSKPNSRESFNSEEFRIIRETIYKLNYGKWWKCFAAQFSFCHLLKFIGLHSILILIISVNYFIFSKNPNLVYTLLSVNAVFTGLFFVSYFYIFFQLSKRYYRVEEFIPNSIDHVVNQHKIHPRVLDYKVQYSSDLKYNRIAIFTVLILVLVVTYIVINPTPLLLMLFDKYEYVDPKLIATGEYINELTRSIMVFFSISSILQQFVFMELIILVPVIIPWINNRLKHLVVGFGIYYLFGLCAPYFHFGGRDCGWAFLGLMWIAALIALDIVLCNYSRRLRRE